jgi:hypothetical protein
VNARTGNYRWFVQQKLNAQLTRGAALSGTPAAGTAGTYQITITAATG